MTTWTWAQSHFSAAHKDKKTGSVHGHTWRVRAYWKLDGVTRDATVMKAQLEGCLMAFDHKCSDDWPCGPWAEQIAQSIKHLINCDKVEVWRDCEGVGAICK